MEIAISKTQMRACRLLGIASGDTYASAKQSLELVDLPGDVIPLGETWRSVAKMSDEQFVAALKNSVPNFNEIANSVIEY